MNYDLAIMALEGMAHAPLTIRLEKNTVRIEGPAASFKELARQSWPLEAENQRDNQ